MPNFVKVDSKPFHPDTYLGPDQEDEELAGAENTRESSMSIKLKVENTLRWRWVKDEDGNHQRQSNSRIIRWSDGSLSLLLGKELFDISQQLYTSHTSTNPTSGSQPSQSQSQTEPSQYSQSTSANQAQGLTYLVAQHKRAEILQSEALITGYMQLRPAGMQSETHRMLVRAVGQKHSKVARLRMAPDPTQDPEKEKMELLKQTSKSRSKRPKTEDDGFGNPRAKRKSHPRKRSGDGVWSDDEEAAYDMYGGESDEDHDLDSSPRRRTARKGTRSSGDVRKEGKYQTDDFVVSDSPSDDGDSESGKKSKRKVADRGHSDEDDLDKLDAKIEQQEEAERKPGKADTEPDDHPEPEEMDVESEEPDEDDDHQVRKAGGKRRRVAVGFDEEEE